MSPFLSSTDRTRRKTCTRFICIDWFNWGRWSYSGWVELTRTRRLPFIDHCSRGRSMIREGKREREKLVFRSVKLIWSFQMMNGLSWDVRLGSRMGIPSSSVDFESSRQCSFNCSSEETIERYCCSARQIERRMIDEMSGTPYLLRFLTHSSIWIEDFVSFSFSLFLDDEFHVWLIKRSFFIMSSREKIDRRRTTSRCPR